MNQKEYSYFSKYDEKEPDAVMEAVQIFLEHGADVTARDDSHSTPLHLASSKGNGKVARLLIRHGADVNAQDGRCKTPFHLAESSHSVFKPSVLRLLLSSGANVTAEDDQGQ